MKSFQHWLMEPCLDLTRATGEIAWRQFVGLGSSIDPQIMDMEHVLVSDVENQSLLKLRTATGTARVARFDRRNVLYACVDC